MSATPPCTVCGAENTACNHATNAPPDVHTVAEPASVHPAPGSRRARLEAKLEKRTVWAGKAVARAETRFATARRIGDSIPLGQPILVGHHSERRSRADAERIHSNLTKAVEQSHLAEHHEQRASGIAAQLERSVFSDDTNAVAALEARIAGRQAEVAQMKAVNAAFKKAKGEAPERLVALAAAGVISHAEALELSGRMQLLRYDRPFPSYALTNLNGNNRRDRDRIAQLKVRQARTETARAQGGVKLEVVGDYVRLTFAEKPEREVLSALRDAGFRWGGGSWVGTRDKLPPLVSELLAPASPAEPPSAPQPHDAIPPVPGSPPGCTDIPGDCRFCGNVCEPAYEPWTCSACGVTYAVAR